MLNDTSLWRYDGDEVELSREDGIFVEVVKFFFKVKLIFQRESSLKHPRAAIKQQQQ